MVLDRAFKEVERAVIFVVKKVFDIVLELHFELVAIIVLSDLEFRLLELVVQGLERPFAHVPSLCTACV